MLQDECQGHESGWKGIKINSLFQLIIPDIFAWLQRTVKEIILEGRGTSASELELHLPGTSSPICTYNAVPCWCGQFSPKSSQLAPHSLPMRVRCVWSVGILKFPVSYVAVITMPIVVYCKLDCVIVALDYIYGCCMLNPCLDTGIIQYVAPTMHVLCDLCKLLPVRYGDKHLEFEFDWLRPKQMFNMFNITYLLSCEHLQQTHCVDGPFSHKLVREKNPP